MHPSSCYACGQASFPSSVEGGLLHLFSVLALSSAPAFYDHMKRSKGKDQRPSHNKNLLKSRLDSTMCNCEYCSLLPVALVGGFSSRFLSASSIGENIMRKSVQSSSETCNIATCNTSAQIKRTTKWSVMQMSNADRPLFICFVYVADATF